MKLQNYRTDYQRAIHRLAERIIAIGDESSDFFGDDTTYGMTKLDFDSLPSAFGPASARRTAESRLQIAVLAHDTSTLPAGRSSDYYGSTPHAWSPYRPDYTQPVADYARELAKKCLDTTPLVSAFGDGTASWAKNGRPVPPSLCIVDPWVSLSAKYEEQLARLDQIQEPWVSVLVPWNSRDPGMIEAGSDLRANLLDHLGRKLAGVPAPLPDGRERDPHPRRFWPTAARNGNDHVEEIPQRGYCSSAVRSLN